MPKARDLVGLQFGRLSVFKEAGHDANGKRLWLCHCICGASTKVRSGALMAGKVNSCGCSRAAQDLKGKRFSRLLVIRKRGHSKYGRQLWQCRCDCGRSTIVADNSLISGTTRSCGCLQREAIYRTALAHNHEGHNRSHNLSTHPLYYIWHNMMARCYNPAHPGFRYWGGARPPVKVYQRWHKLENFITDIVVMIGLPSRGKSIDRWPDPAGDYCPGNVRWATPTQQANNKRKFS
jgi:hypothetical protein